MTRDEFSELIIKKVKSNMTIMDDDSMPEGVQIIALGFNEGITFVLDLLTQVEELSWSQLDD